MNNVYNVLVYEYERKTHSEYYTLCDISNTHNTL